MAELQLPEDYNSVPTVIVTLSSVLQRAADRAEEARHHPVATHRLSSFTGPTKPAISIRSYLERIFRHVDCSPSCYVVAYIYLDRFARRLPVDSLNVHRLLITSILLAIKFVEDNTFYNNAYFAKVGGINVKEMNSLELDFLFGLKFELNVSPDVFISYCSILQRERVYLGPPGSTLARNSLLSFFSEEDEEEDEPDSTTQKQLDVITL